MNHKIKYLNVLAIVLIASILVACQTAPVVTTTTNADGSTTSVTNAPKVNINQIALGIKTLATAATIAGISPPASTKHPEIRTDLVAGVAIIDLLLANKTYDPAALNSALATVTAKESASTAQEISLGATTVLALYQSNYSSIVADKVNGNANARTILLAVRNGIADGLLIPEVQ